MDTSELDSVTIGVWKEAYEAQVSRWVGVSAFVFLVWDMLVSLADEVEFIWRGPNTWVKYAYLFIRHFGILILGTLLAQTTNVDNHLGFTLESCYAWNVFEGVVSVSLVIAVEAVLLIRIYAFYERSKTILIFTTTLFVGEIVTVITTMAMTMPVQKMSIELGCVVTWVPSVYKAIWIASLSFQTVLFVLTIVKYIRSINRSLGRQTLLYVFVRDGVWAYFALFVVLLLNLLMFEINSSPLAPICFKWGLSIVSFTGSHVLLNLRRLITPSKPPRLPHITVSITGTRTSTSSDVVFTPRDEITMFFGESRFTSGDDVCEVGDDDDDESGEFIDAIEIEEVSVRVGGSDLEEGGGVGANESGDGVHRDSGVTLRNSSEGPSWSCEDRNQKVDV